MTNPTVCCVVLVNGREKMVARAIKSFREQTYQNKRLLILNTGLRGQFSEYDNNEIVVAYQPSESKAATIGTLRNDANSLTDHILGIEANIICHWDSDDWSHPRRIEEQVALLQASGKQCVGYRDCLFWDTTKRSINLFPAPAQLRGGRQVASALSRETETKTGQAWLYSHATKPLGTSLCYWRKVWEQRPFPDLPKAKGGTGEDVAWLEGVDYRAESMDLREPRMIASIHGDNTQYYDPAEGEKLSNGTSWRRAEQWDEFCARTMAL